MLTQETKRRIDAARDILVGQLPLPSDQTELITIALIYKFMDDMDEQSRELGGRPSFFTGDLRELSWRNLIANTISAEERVAKFLQGIEGISDPKQNHIPQLFKGIFKNAFLKFRDGRILKLFLDEINGFTYDHSEELGNAFEYLLQSMGVQGENGQFRTPRHIIDFMVACLDPQPDDKILDPACGTAGFLVSAYRHILRTNMAQRPGDTLTQAQRVQLKKNITGYDITPLMVRLAKVNLFLHDFPDPDIHEYDTLTNDARWDEKADLLLANPPFMTPKGGVAPHTKFAIESNRAETLFLDYVLEHLTPKGRAGIIVPEGIMFVGHGAQERLRKMLAADKLLFATVSLPHGVFKPYASVKTHILFVDRILAAQTDRILFIETESDGFSQTDTRLPVKENCLPAAKALIHGFREAIRANKPPPVPDPKLRAYYVERERTTKSQGTHLVGRWYDVPTRLHRKKGMDYDTLGRLCEIHDGRSPNMATLPGEHTMVVPAEARKSADHFDFEGKAVCIPLVSTAGHGKADMKRIHYQEGKFALATTMCCLMSRDEKVLNPRFLYFLLDAVRYEILVPLMAGATNVTMGSDQLLDVQIPLPSLDDQLQVVKRTDLLAYAEKLESLARNLHRDVSNSVGRSTAQKLTGLAANLRRQAKPLLDLRKLIGVKLQIPPTARDDQAGLPRPDEPADSTDIAE